MAGFRNSLFAFLIALPFALLSCGQPKSRVPEEKLEAPAEGFTAEILAEIAAFEPAEDFRGDNSVLELLKSELARQIGSGRLLSERKISKAPTGAAGTVTDLSGTQVGEGFELTWTYKNTGDYDQSGEVSVADITPIALHFLHNNGAGAFPDAADVLIDGDGNGEVGVSDVTSIAINYLGTVSGYDIEYSYDGIEFDWIDSAYFDP
ncbi:MAG: hypothetical protein HRF49_03305 [bacterium]|jgi:hypothetical protein